ncbi:hypothetical protein QA641_06590 [Bradyrhizobium sp. CB1650]|uniref:hypothetical protein n=1 Tax=Bradyrhizobium sp. CB1650 TaxID=3039153 RepID=UPI0024350B44|nr:hypothetical protein [Bradyrhizobium sp. CB1650]WGD53574.1 hypothetical protein QA641_06590 [Bradyrhizobium sp. CB1650]
MASRFQLWRIFTAKWLNGAGKRPKHHPKMHGMISTMANLVKDRILAELLEITEVLLRIVYLKDRAALPGTQQALRNLLDPDTSEPASKRFYRIDARAKAADASQH